MDHDAYDEAVGASVLEAIMKAFGSVRGGAQASGIAYATLDRKIKGLSSFTVGELRRIGRLTKRSVRSFLPSESAR